MPSEDEVQVLLKRIRREQDGFSAAQKLTAAYVVENYHQIPFLSITQLAKNIGVSENTVVKFCNRLGFSKFGTFKKIFSSRAHVELVLSNRLSEEDSSPDHLSQGMNDDINSITATLTDPANHKALEQLLPMLDRAEHIYITGGRASGYMAGLFANALRYLNLKAHDVTFGVGDYLDRLSLIGPKDLVIAICLPRYTAQVVNGLKSLHQSGVPIALITDTGLSPAYPYADVVFCCSVTSGYYFPCYAGCHSLISAICRAAAASRKNEALDYVQNLERRLIMDGTFL